MHHSLKLYSRYREYFLRYFIFQAKWTGIPLVGGIVRWVANLYGKQFSNAYVLTLDEAQEIVDSSERLALGPCDCRTVFKNCDNPVNTEIMVGLSQNVFVTERPGDYREISREEAKAVLKQCHEHGLVHTIARCRRNLYAICNCCSCCCVPLRLNRNYGIGNAVIRDDDIVRRFKEQLSSTPSR